MKILRILALILTIGLISCNTNRVYEKHQKDFPKNRWEKSNVLTFSPTIEDTTATYRVYLALRHVYGFQFGNMKTKVTSTTPLGDTTTKNYEFTVVGPDKKYLSECAEDICDLEAVIEENVKFSELGTYKYTVEHEMPVDPLPNVMEFGLIIEKHEAGK